MIALVPLLFAQAALSAPGINYFARTDYEGPGLVCGSGFAVQLRAGERAVLSKPSTVQADYAIHLAEGVLTISESQLARQGGSIVVRTTEGTVRRRREQGRNVWDYQDGAPGSTVVSGPAVDTPRMTTALRRVTFGAPRHQMVDGVSCLRGTGSDARGH